MNPEDVMLSEVNQTQNGKQNCMNQKKKTILSQKQQTEW